SGTFVALGKNDFALRALFDFHTPRERIQVLGCKRLEQLDVRQQLLPCHVGVSLPESPQSRVPGPASRVTPLFLAVHLFAGVPLPGMSSNIMGATPLDSPISSMTRTNVSANRRRSAAGILSSASRSFSWATGGDLSATALPLFVRLRTRRRA